MRMPGRRASGEGVKSGLVILCAALLLLLGSGSVAADDTTTVLGAIADFESLVLENNRELAALRAQLIDLEETVSQVLLLDTSGLSVNGGYSYNSPLTNNTHSVSGSVSANVPVLPQISIGGQVNSSGDASLTLAFTPLAALGTNVVAEQELATKRLTIAHKRLELQWQSRIMLLQYAAAGEALEDAEESVSLGQQEYEHAESQFEAGLSSHANLQSAADDLAARSEDRINAMRQESEVERDLYQLAGTTHIPEGILSIAINPDQLRGLISDAHVVYKEISDSSVFTSLSQQAMQVQKYFLEKQLESTWFFEPNVSLSVSGSVSGAFDTPAGSAGANVSLSLSAASFNFDEMQVLRDEIEDLERDLQIERFVSKIDEQNAGGSLEAAELSAEIAERQCGSVGITLEQASHDLEQSKISELEYSSIRLSMSLAETSYLNSLIAIYSQLGTLLQSYGDMELQGDLP